MLEDGSNDPAFSPPHVNDSIIDMALQPDGKIIVTGRFTEINGIERNRMARLNSDRSLNMSFDPQDSANSIIEEIAVLPSDKILVGRAFSSFNGFGRRSLVMLMPPVGSLVLLGAEIHSYVIALDSA